MTTAYPLAWPQGRQRTPPMRRRAGRFCRDGKRLTVAGALSRVKREIVSAGGYLPVISTNVELRLDGVPRSGQREPEDPGVAIYMQIGGRPHCLPCDTYDRVADNLAAVAAHIEATRAIERHGVASVEEMFAGFVALPAPGAPRPWHQVLGVAQTATRDEIERAYRERARSAHPDAGGSDALMAEINAARAAALK